jgi:pyrroloquinoline-quinone synthase
MTATADFVQELQELIARSDKNILRHPFVQGVAAGTIPLHQLQGWVAQDYVYRKQVARLAMVRYLRCSDPEIAAHLYEVVDEEATGSVTGTAGHVQLYVDFAAGLGVSQEQLDAAPTLPGAAAHIYWAELIMYTQPWFVALAAQMAGEGVAPQLSRTLYGGLKTHYGLDDRALAWCRTHEVADAEHGALSELIVARYLTVPALQAQARAIVQRKLELQWDMWDTYRFF